MKNKEIIRESIRKNYAKVATKGSNGGCCNGGSCGCSIDVNAASERLGYTELDLANAPKQANMGLGCGNPIAIAELKEGETVLDLGCGGGFDCFLARRKVGDSGYVIGVDMTPEMIKLARENTKKSGYNNVDFRLGEIEHLPVADNSVDAIISNCVINLSLDKKQVYREAYRVLKPSGRLSISDIVATIPLPENMKNDLSLISSCIGGAEYIEDIITMLKAAGFVEVKLTPKDNSREIVSGWSLEGKNIEDYIASYIIEAKK